MSYRRPDHWSPTSAPRRTGAVPDPECPDLRERFVRKVAVGPIHTRLLTPCWLWTAALDSGGYGSFFTGWEGRKVWRAHVVAWIVTHGWGARPKPPMEVCHACDVPACVRPDHLYLATHEERMRHKKERGRAAHDDLSNLGPQRPARGAHHGSVTHPESVPRGERAVSAKLTEAQVIAIRESVNHTQAELSKEYRVSQVAIGAIRRGETWAHVGGPRTTAGKGHSGRRTT